MVINVHVISNGWKFYLLFFFFFKVILLNWSIFLSFLKQCTGTEFTIQGDLMKCGVTETETCLKAITLALSDGSTVSTKKDWGREKNRQCLPE